MTGSFAARVLCLACLACVACSSEVAPKPIEARRVPKKAPSTAVVKAKAPVLYDAAGNLLPSDARIAWLELPRGLTELKGAPSNLRAYRTQGIPLDLVQAFFGARLLPARITKLGAGGVTFVASVPPSGGGKGVVRIDVSVVPGAQGMVNVLIEERPALPATRTLTEAEARTLLREQEKRAE